MGQRGLLGLFVPVCLWTMRWKDESLLYGCPPVSPVHEMCFSVEA